MGDIVGEDPEGWLFGSRVDDAKRGRDIDVLIETPRSLTNQVSLLCRLERALVMRLGDRKIEY